MSRKTAFILLAFILAVSFGLRLIQLNSGLWLDEMTTYLKYARLPFGEIIRSFESENQHFLYSILAHASFLVFGESNWALRLPAVLFGVASILALFLFGLEVTDPLQALLASSLMAFSYHHVWFSQNARGYIGLLFFTILSSWLLLKALRGNRTLVWILFAITAALGVYTHLTMGFVIVGQFLAFLYYYLRNRNQRPQGFWNGVLLGFFMAGLLIVLLHLPVIGEMRTVIGGTQTSDVEAWKSPLWTLQELVRGLQVGFSGLGIGIIALAVFLYGLVSYWRTSPEFIIIFIIPPLLGAAITIAIGHHLWPRFFFFAMGFGALIVVRGLMLVAELAGKMLKMPRRGSMYFGAILCLLLIGFSALSIPRAFGPKQDYGGALKYLQSAKATGDRIVTINFTDFAYHDFFHTNWDAITTVAELAGIESQGGNTWVVYTFPEVLKAKYPEVYDKIQTDFELVKKFDGTVGDGDVFIYLRPAQSK